MRKDFWFEKWEKNDIGFHESTTHPLLVSHFDALGLKPGSRIFVPLCGKTLDIAWLLSKELKVVGVELVEKAVVELFDNLNLKPEVCTKGNLKLYQSESLKIFVGDVFNLTEELLGTVDAIYDRAAFVALPDEMRKRYVTHIPKITSAARQLLITFEYDESKISGPPFSHSPDSVKAHYQESHDATLLSCKEPENGLKGHPAKEYIWLLEKNN